ncbi:MAG: glutamine-hydrolyzing GMP synthase [Oscillospiraceae bacterium]|jgi:GMP synthase (glutamine-hydrolysing)|nr:glutamine-hydrolyzing GMP synthase [Oscillospiraceae bacterium]
MGNQLALILDYGGQYKELIAQRVRQLGVYSEIHPGSLPVGEIKALGPIAIILTGGPRSVYAPGSPQCDPELFNLGIPVLGICYGMHLMCHTLGGRVMPGSPEYGRVNASLDTTCALFAGMRGEAIVLMSHGDAVAQLPSGFATAASTAQCGIVACGDGARRLYAVQFHPEVKHTEDGTRVLHNFLYGVCRAAGDYRIEDYIARATEDIRAKAGGRQVLLALSGGVDSSVCAALFSQAIPGQLVCVFVDHGLMRKDEGDMVEAVFAKRKLRFIRVNAEKRFLAKLRGVTDPERKRKLIGEEFVAVFEEEARKIGDVPYLAQGTIYPDVIESGGGPAATIKSHHNVGGLPERMKFEAIIEPLRGLFKDEVRNLGRKLGLPRALVERQPFPGPGLAIRVMGAVTRAKLDVLREADSILRQELDKARKRPDQYFAVYTGVRSVGVVGDARSYDTVIAIRAVETSDFMTCEYAPVPHPLLQKIAARIVNEVQGAGRVVYDITGKPPATVEWE